MARGALGELVANLRLEYGDYVKGIDASARETAKAATSMQSRVDKMAKGISGALMGLVAGFSVAGIVAGVTAVIDKFDRLDAAAQQLGQSAKYIQEMGFVAGQSKSNLEDFTKGFTALSVKIGQARNDNAAVIAQFAAVGISLDDLRKKDAPQIWDMISDAVANAASETDRMAIAAQFFEKEMGARLIPTLANGSEKTEELRQRFRDLGGVIDDEVIGAAGRLNDQKAQLGIQAEALGNRITAYLIPTLLELITDFNNAQIAGESLTFTLTNGVARGLAAARADMVALGKVYRANSLSDSIAKLYDQNQKLEAEIAAKGENRLLFNANKSRAIIQKNMDEIKRLSAELDKAIPQTKPTTAEDMLRGQEFTAGKMDTAASRAMRERIAALKSQNEDAKKASAKPRAAKAAKAEKPEIDKDIDEIRRALESIESPAQKYTKQIAEIQRWHASGKVDAQDYSRLIDSAAKNVGESLGTWRQYEETQREIANVFEATRTPMERYYTDLAKLNDLLAGGLDYDAYTRALFDLNDALDDAIITQRDMGDEAKDVFTQMADAANGWADQFAAALLDGEMNLKSFAASVVKQLATIAISSSVQPLFEMFGKKMRGESIAGRATGGGVDRDTPYLLGEHGAEVFIPHSAGRIEKGAGRAQIVQSFTFTGAPNPGELRAWAAQIKAETIAAVASETGRGGKFARAMGAR